MKKENAHVLFANFAHLTNQMKPFRAKPVKVDSKGKISGKYRMVLPERIKLGNSIRYKDLWKMN